VIYYSYRSKVKINLKLKEEIAHHQETSSKLREMERERFKNKNLESIGILAGGIAHDFNNLLSVIIGSISLAKERTSSREEELVLLDRAEQFSMQAANLAGKLLTFSKGDMLIRKESDLSHLLQKAIDFEPPDRRYTIQLDITDPLMPIYGDERQLVPAFSNIIQNAGDAMPRGGVITIRAANTAINENNPFHLLTGQFVQLSIRDTGIGIPEENIGKIFDPYFSTKDKGVQSWISSIILAWEARRPCSK
jgi:signal transduction histidine kinase